VRFYHWKSDSVLEIAFGSQEVRPPILLEDVAFDQCGVTLEIVPGIRRINGGVVLVMGG
jgi:hypothetical protein